MESLNDNPYRSPTAESNSPRTPTKSVKGLVELVLFVFGAFAGGFIGNLLGTLAVYFLGVLPRPLQPPDFLVITHPLGVALLVLGCFFGAWAGLRITGRPPPNTARAAKFGIHAESP